MSEETKGHAMSAIIQEEQEFPRGGGDVLTPLERRKLREKAERDAAKEVCLYPPRILSCVNEVFISAKLTTTLTHSHTHTHSLSLPLSLSLSLSMQSRPPRKGLLLQRKRPRNQRTSPQSQRLVPRRSRAPRPAKHLLCQRQRL